MRIAYVIDTLYPWELGGAQKRVWEIARRLSDDHDVHVYGMRYWDDGEVTKRDGITYHGVCEKRELYTDGRRSMLQPLVFSANLLAPLLREDFDVIDCQKSSYFHFFPSKIKSSLSDTALVGTFNEIWGDYWYDHIGWKGVFGKAVEWTTLRLPDEIITISQKNRRDLGRFGIDEERVTVIPDGIGFDEIYQVPPSEESFDVLYAGRLVEHKNVDLLIDAVARLHEEGQEVTCGVVGDGPQMEELRRHAADRGVPDDVTFLGFLEDIDDVYGYMKTAGVFVLPSSREGAGLVTLEANACGVPSVTTRHENNAATEVVENGVNGYVADVSVDGLARSIRRALNDAAALSEGCVEYSKRYDWDNMAEDTEAVYYSARR